MATKYIIDNLAGQTISGSLSATTLSADTFYGDGSNLTGVSGGSFTGGTVSGETIFDGGLSATTFSATTIDLCTSNGTLYTDSISGCSPINILSPTNFTEPISANTIYISGNPITQPYKVYTALLTQTASGNPVVTIVENTLGTITIARDSDGRYSVNSSNLFTSNKTIAYISTITPSAGPYGGYASINYASQSILYIDTVKVLNTDVLSVIPGTGTDNVLYNTPIEIRVYN